MELLEKILNCLKLNKEEVKKEIFEQIWLAQRANDEYNLAVNLNDDDYINYQIWEKANNERLYEKHKKLISETRIGADIVFHGRCVDCISQKIHGIERCKGCQYFKFIDGKPDLHIKCKKIKTITKEEIIDLLG